MHQDNKIRNPHEPDELKREELIEHLDWWRKVAHIGSTCEKGNTCDQAYNQIVALIKKEVTEEWIEEKAKGISHAFNDIYRVGMEQAKDFIRSLVEEIKGKPSRNQQT